MGDSSSSMGELILPHKSMQSDHTVSLHLQECQGFVQMMRDIPKHVIAFACFMQVTIEVVLGCVGLLAKI